MFCIDEIQVISLMHHIQEKIQLKAGHLRNVTIACHKFKNIPVYECGVKCIQSLFKEYNDALLKVKGSIGFITFHDTFKMLTFRG